MYHWFRTALAFLVLISGSFAAENQSGYDAGFVGMSTVPKRLLAGEVFFIEIVMKNTGSQEWGPQNEKHAVLRSQDPADNRIWGTQLIIQGQGKTVPVGSEFKFTSWLMAPLTPGEYPFQWRLGSARDHGFRGPVELFGEPTPRTMVKVEARPEQTVASPARTQTGQQVLTAADFEYAGSFKVPDRPGHDMPFSHSGLALRKMKDGSKRLLFNYTLPKFTLVELEIPPLVKLVSPTNLPASGVGGRNDTTDYRALKVAETKRVWGKLENKVKDKISKIQETIWANGSYTWDEPSKTLFWTWWSSYYCDEPPPLLGASRLNDDGTITPLGAWKVEPGMYKWYWGGVLRLPSTFAAKYTGGKTLALGFGTGYSGTYAGSHGPSLSVIPDPDPAQPALKATHLLGYYQGENAPRDGLYFIATNDETRDSWIGKQPDSPTKGYFTSSDLVRNAIFIDTPHKHGLIAFVHLQMGRIAYDYGSGTSGSVVHCWYCYDPEDLAAVAQGRLKPGQVIPYARTSVPLPGGTRGYITGSCFDEETGLLYLYNTDAKGCIHAFRLKD